MSEGVSFFRPEFLEQFGNVVGARLLLGQEHYEKHSKVYTRPPNVFAVWSQPGNKVSNHVYDFLTLGMVKDAKEIMYLSFQDCNNLDRALAEIPLPSAATRVILIESADKLIHNDILDKSLLVRDFALSLRARDNTVVICCFDRPLPPVTPEKEHLGAFIKQFDFEFYARAPTPQYLEAQCYRPFFAEYKVLFPEAQIALSDDDYKTLAEEYSYCCTELDVRMFLQTHVAMMSPVKVDMEYLVGRMKDKTIVPYGSPRDMENEFARCVGQSIPEKEKESSFPAKENAFSPSPSEKESSFPAKDNAFSPSEKEKEAEESPMKRIKSE